MEVSAAVFRQSKDSWKKHTAGHPAQPIVVTPRLAAAFSLAMDAAYLLTGKKSFAAFYSIVGGFLGGVISAATVAADYFSIPANAATKKAANFHAPAQL